jgi:hypothetical protein
MMRYSLLKHRFVQYIPEHLEPGVLYVSLDYATAAHSCCCGCGEEVVTPFTPNDWKMIFDGETISLWPSVGNWQLRCRSHYVIERGRAIVAPAWSDERVAAQLEGGKAAKARYFGTPKPMKKSGTVPVQGQNNNPETNLLSHIISWFLKLWHRR